VDVLTLTANGELQAKIEPASGGEGSDTTWYSYDAFGNLVQVRMPRQKDGGQANGDVIEYVIDGQNRRVGKKLNGTLVKGWLYEGQLRPVAELDAAGNATARYVYGAKVNVPEYIIKGSVTYRVITDHLGSVRLVVDQTTGSVAQQMEYDEWGNLLADSNPDLTPFGFAGSMYDGQTKLTRFGARDYDVITGRWTLKDPILFNGYSANFYDYVFSDPINFIDIDGEKCNLADIIARAAKNYKNATEIVPGTTIPGIVGAVRMLAGNIPAGPNAIPSAALGIYMRMQVAQGLATYVGTPSLGQALWGAAKGIVTGTGASLTAKGVLGGAGVSAASAAIVMLAFDAGLAYGSVFAAILQECGDPCH